MFMRRQQAFALPPSQVDPGFTAFGFSALKPKQDEPLLSFVFIINLRHYTKDGEMELAKLDRALALLG